MNFQRLLEERSGEDVHNDQAIMVNESPTEHRQGRLDKPASFNLASLASVRGTPYVDGRGGPEAQRRALQSTCTEGDSFSITSSVFPSIEGCYSDLGSESVDGNVIYGSLPSVVVSVEVFNTTTNETIVSRYT